MQLHNNIHSLAHSYLAMCQTVDIIVQLHTIGHPCTFATQNGDVGHVRAQNQ